MAIGRGFRLMAGRGLATSHLDGRLITTGVGSITITTGPGRHAANMFAGAVGGGPRWWRSTSRSATTSAGIRCRTTKEIHIRVTIVVTIVIEIEIVIGIADRVTVEGAMVAGTVDITAILVA